MFFNLFIFLQEDQRKEELLSQEIKKLKESEIEFINALNYESESLPRRLWSKYYNFDRKKCLESLKKKEECQKSIQGIERRMIEVIEKISKERNSLEEKTSKKANLENAIDQYSRELENFDQNHKQKVC